MKENNKKEKTYTVWRREEVHYEYLVKANSREEAKEKVEKCTYDLDSFGHLVNYYYEDWHDGESVYEIFEGKDDNESEYPFEEGDIYYTLEDGKWIESCWDDVSEEMHDENPNKKYYKAMNLESEVQNA